MNKTIFSLFVLITFFNIAIAQDKGSAYNWPVKPGTPEWKALKNHNEKLSVLQIPDDVLKNMSTIDLVETCLNYPLFPDIWAFNSYQKGIDIAIKSFNGFQELLSRKDAGKNLINQYVKINLEDYDKKNTFIEKGDFKMWTCKIEALLTQDAILNNLEKTDKELLLIESIKKGEKFKKNQTYSFFNNETNFFLTLKLLSVENPEKVKIKIKNNKNFEHFSKNGSEASQETINDIADLANYFLSRSN